MEMLPGAEMNFCPLLKVSPNMNQLAPTLISRHASFHSSLNPVVIE